ncbi:hypothetical protein V2A60_003331 [Cordyceps javanica]|uniref:Uncharacterized protein n=1 Tax=Cordyceps javanica TaxID=43265 RepID=A0A545V3E7_9HYPO|nr:hypothetical protein IF1G_04822 [Cordyceps javanica]TQW07540.1 hypothetical protein IF2G_04701 [Cordyceps javanica]
MDTATQKLKPPRRSSLPGRRNSRAGKSRASNKSLSIINTEKIRSHVEHEARNAPRNETLSAAEESRQLSFQRHGEALWKKGPENLGNRNMPHVDIEALPLPATPSSSDHDSIIAQAVIHSQRKNSVGLRRKFDLDQVHATIPEPARSPSTPDFDPKKLLSAIADTNETPAPTTSKQPVIPMHLQYARHYLPILASIIMQGQHYYGGTFERIELPMPHPTAWAETVAWVYTGEATLVTDQVRENVKHFGGRLCEE